MMIPDGGAVMSEMGCMTMNDEEGLLLAKGDGHLIPFLPGEY